MNLDTFTYGGEQYTLGNVRDLGEIPTGGLLQLYNKLTGKTTKKFKDRTAGLNQTWAALETKRATAQPAATAPVPTAPKAKKAAKPAGERKKREKRFVFPVEKEIKEPKPGSKRAEVVRMLERQNGATLGEIQERIGWSEKDAYEGTRLVHYACGFGMSQDANGRIHLVRPQA